MTEPRVFALAGRKSQEIPAEWRAARRQDPPEFSREHSVEVAPGVFVRLLGHGDIMLPDGSVSSGAEIAVWSEVIDMGYVSLPAEFQEALERPVPPVWVVVCARCGSQDEYGRPDPLVHTCGHFQPPSPVGIAVASLAEDPGGSLNPTPDCGYTPRKPPAATELWWCAEHSEFHKPKGNGDG